VHVGIVEAGHHDVMVRFNGFVRLEVVWSRPYGDNQAVTDRHIGASQDSAICIEGDHITAANECVPHMSLRYESTASLQSQQDC